MSRQPEIKPALGFVAWLAATTALFLQSCASTPMLPYSRNAPALVLTTVEAPPVRDARVRFREIFCALLSQDSGAPDCERLLPHLDGEPRGAGDPRPLPESDPRLKLILLPGLFDNCFSQVVQFYSDALPAMKRAGYDIEVLNANGRSSSRENAARIAEYVATRPAEDDDKFVLIGHSKGVVDSMYFLVNHPQHASRIAALVSVAGAVNGSPLADWLVRGGHSISRLIPDAWCEPGDNAALSSLQRGERLTWMKRHLLPESIRYFSLSTFTSREFVPWPLRYSYDLLSEIDPRNDGLLLSFDQVIPGSEFLGAFFVDHWRVAYPLETDASFLSAGADGSRPVFPRSILLESVALYLSEALASHEQD